MTMTIDRMNNGTERTLKIGGRLDASTAPALERELDHNLNGVETLCLDFSELEYLSSAGLRVLLTAQKKMNQQGRMIVRHVNETVMEVFQITGFSEILTIE